MKSGIFLKRYTLILPRLWLILFFIALICCVIVFLVKSIANYLAITEPVAGTYLVVEGWQDESSFVQALRLFRNSEYKALITTGGPVSGTLKLNYHSYADYAASFFIEHGLDKKRVISLAAPASAQNRTFLSAVIVRKWLNRHSPENYDIDVFTQGVHARRTRMMYEKAFRNKIKVGIYSAKPEGYHLSSWWKTSLGTKTVITESIGFLWAVCCFSPGEYGSKSEIWGVTHEH